MYDVKYENGEWWITKDGNIVEILGGFSDPITPQIILKEIKENGEI